MQLWSAICLAGLALAAPAEPNGVGTLEPRVVMPGGSDPRFSCRNPRLSKVGGMHKREPRVLMPGESVTNPACPGSHPRLSKASPKIRRRSEDALEKREPWSPRPVTSVTTSPCRGSRCNSPPMSPGKTSKRSEDALEKREPILLPDHPPVAGGESAAAADKQAANIGKREPGRSTGHIPEHQPVYELDRSANKNPPKKSHLRGRELRDADERAYVEKREPRKSGAKPGTRPAPKRNPITFDGPKRKFRDEIIIPEYGTGPQRRDVDEEAAEVAKRFVSIGRPLHGIAPAYRRIRTWAAGH